MKSHVAYWRCFLIHFFWPIAAVVGIYPVDRLLSFSLWAEAGLAIVLALFLLAVFVKYVIGTTTLGQTIAVSGWYILVATLVIVVAISVRIFVVSPFIVTGGAMEPHYSTDDMIFANLLVSDYRRGDVVVFEYPRDPSKYFIMRIAAVPGDTIEIEPEKITIFNEQFPNGIIINEPYAYGSNGGSVQEVLREGEYFVLGDNRESSSDSRSWGVLTEERIAGKVIPQRP